LRTSRKKAKLTQAQLAERLFVRALTVSRWECGQQTPSEARQRQIRQIFEGAGPEMVSEGSAAYRDESSLVRLSPEEQHIVRIYRRLMGQGDKSA